MKPQDLANGLVEIGFKNTEPEAIEGWIRAWVAYFSTASAGVVVVASALRGPPATAMRGALTGMSTPGAGARAIQNAIVHFWSTLSGAPSSFFPGAIAVTPPPTLSGIASAISAIMSGNTRGNVPAPTAYSALAAAIHGCNQGGTATFPGAPPIVIPIV